MVHSQDLGQSFKINFYDTHLVGANRVFLQFAQWVTSGLYWYLVPGTLVAQEHNGEYGIGKYFAVRGTTVG